MYLWGPPSSLPPPRDLGPPEAGGREEPDPQQYSFLKLHTLAYLSDSSFVP